MSLLMFQLTPEAVMVLTDTLATTPAGDPCLLVTKCAIVPHLDMVAAGTGFAALPERWRTIVYGQVLARDIDMLDRHTPAALAHLWTELANEHGDHGVTATVYHLGISEATAEYTGYAYRSTEGFQSERLEPGFRVKPEPSVIPAGPPGPLEEWLDLAHEIRQEQSRQPRADAIHIGGELNLIVMQQRTILSVKVHRYDDFEDIWQQMNDLLSPGSCSPITY